MLSRLSRLGLLITLLIVTTSPIQGHPVLQTTDPTIFLPLISTSSGVSLTSDQLIDAALARGEISAETALVYRVYVVFGDSRLPVHLRGDDRTVVDGDIIKAARTQYASLSPAAQAILAPYLIPPIYRGSWEDPASATGVDTAHPSTPLRSAQDDISTALRLSPKDLTCGEVTPDKWEYVDGAYARVWWKQARPGDRAAAEAYRDAIDATIWPRLTQLMGQEPLSDASSSCSGGAGSLDIYLSDTVAYSFEQSHDPGCKETPGYIVMQVGDDNRILAHEFMHAIQDAYDVHSGCVYGPEYAWLCEATATWAMLWLYPDSVLAGQYAEWFFQPNNSPPPLDLKDGTHEYGAYLFFYFLTHYFGNDGLIRTVWENTEWDDGLPAVDHAIPGGFAGVWDTFALYNWNQPPYDYYRRWGGISLSPETYLGRHPAITGPWDDRQFIRSLSSVAVGYHHYTFAGEAPRLVTFFNGFLYRITQEPLELPPLPGLRTLDDGTLQRSFERAPDAEIKGARVQVLFKAEGDSQWTLKDMTELSHLSWCRDATSERLQELVIIFSNSEHDLTYQAGATGGRGAELLVDNVGCYRLTGSARSLYGVSEGDPISIEDLQELSNVVWERTEAFPDIPYPYIAFRTASGNWTRTYTMSGLCSAHATDSASLSQADASSLYQLYGLEGGNNRAYTGEANLARIMSVPVDCGEYGSYVDHPPSFWWFMVDHLTLMNEHPYLANAAGVLDGKGEHFPGEDLPLFTWNFAPQRQD